MTKHRIETPCGVLYVARMAELDLLEREADAEALTSVEALSSPSRRRERLAWRNLLGQIAESGNDYKIEYAPSGAPQIINSPYKHISVSHSRTHVAVMLSQEPCGVDIESTGRQFERIARRYISDKELALSNSEYWMAAVWSAKEAIYKMIGRSGVDFLRDIRVVAFDAQSLSISVILSDNTPIALQLQSLDDQILAYTL